MIAALAAATLEDPKLLCLSMLAQLQRALPARYKLHATTNISKRYSDINNRGALRERRFIARPQQFAEQPATQSAEQMLRRTAILLHTASLARALTTSSPLFAANAAKKLRPSKDDVDRISWGKPSKKKGVGSRGTPHRLNEAERAEYDRAKARGYVEVAGSAWRKERRDAPLLNTWRNWCDAVARPCYFGAERF